MSKGNNLHALLIGVNYYFPNQLPGGVNYSPLQGCVRDIQQMESFLRSSLGVADENIIRLTASDGGNGGPSEAPSLWPTYGNIVDAFHRMREKAQPGDEVIIHYSGHGGRATSIYPPDVKPGKIDEALVSTDIGTDEGHYVRDLELAHLLHALTGKGLLVTVLLDCCHSGGMTRGDAVARGTGQVDTAARPAERGAVADKEAVLDTWRTLTGGTKAATPITAGGLPASDEWVVLTACRPQELAYEFKFDGQHHNGALTYWLLDALHAGGPVLSYEQLHRRLLTRIRSQFQRQWPQLYGEGRRAVFGRDWVDAQFAVPVVKYNEERGEVVLNAGTAQGVRRGAQLAIFPTEAADLGDVDAAVAHVTVKTGGATESTATVDEMGTDNTIEPGAQAVLVNPASVRLRSYVRLQTEGEGALPAEGQEALRAAHDAAQFGGFVELVGAEDRADFIIAAKDGHYEIWDPGGEVIPRINPPLPLDGAEAAAGVIKRLIHLARYRNVRQLANSDRGARDAPRVTFEWLDVAQDHTFSPGDEPVLLVRNDSEEAVEVAILELAPDWSITQIYPDGAAPSYTFDPGAEDELLFEVYLEGEQGEETSIYKLFATTDASNFRLLELPSLDQRTRLVKRAPDNELERLLAQVAETGPQTRAGRMRTSAGRHWTTAQVELHVAAPEQGE